MLIILAGTANPYANHFIEYGKHDGADEQANHTQTHRSSKYTDEDDDHWRWQALGR